MCDRSMIGISAFDNSVSTLECWSIVTTSRHFAPFTSQFSQQLIPFKCQPQVGLAATHQLAAIQCYQHSTSRTTNLRLFSLFLAGYLVFHRNNVILLSIKAKGKVIPLQTLRVPGSWCSQISRQSAHEGCKVVSRTHRPPLPPRKHSWYSFRLEAESSPGP
jgi:hypothetical protein